MISADVDNASDSWQAVIAGTASANGYGTYELGADGTWSYTLDDNNAAVQALNGAATLTDTFTALTADGIAQIVTITIHAQNDATVIEPDAFTTDEATAVNGSVFADNGSGADGDVDDPLVVSAVNGSGANVGTQITLASGAHLTLNADGTFAYDPNHAFDATPTSSSGASNTPAHDSFTYTLATGGTVTVDFTINGLDSNDTLIGTAGADVLVGGIGNDSIDGLAGDDGMYGGLGDDVYIFDNPGDFAIEAAGEGHDRAFTTVSYALTPGSEIELLSAFDNAGTGAMDLYGNELANEIWGNAGVNFLAGGGGNDALIGFGGDDTMIGEAGADYLDGGDGNDALFGGDGVDTLVGGAGNDYLDGGTGEDGMYGGAGDDTYFFDQAGDFAIEAVGGGNDRVFTTVSYALTPGSDIELLSAIDNNASTAMDLTGNELANDIWANNGVNFITGGGGNDVLVAFGGADTVLAGSGNDYVDGGTGDDTLIGDDGNDFMVGGDGNDYLDGGIGDDVLVGGIGADYMNGNAGADGMYGGAGDDTYIFDQAGDFAIEAAGGGNDRAFASVSYALTPGSEIELLSALDNNGTSAMDLTGNELANEIWGNAGVNVLTGGGGNDTLLAFGGADTVIAGDGADYVDGGLGNDALFGGTGDDTMIGGDGNDYIDGGTGNDGMYGGTGDDIYFVDSAGDFTIEAAGQGNDTVYTAVNFTLAAGSEVELVSAIDNNATSAIDITGNELANQLWGNNGVNTLSGGAGNDALLGFGGNDTLAGGTGNDYLNGGAGQDHFLFDTALGAGNVDIVADFASGTDKFVLDDAIFNGLGLGTLPSSVFHIGASATDEDQRIIYDSATGNLYYDADGNGAGAQVLFATVGAGTTIIATDFIVA